MKINLNNILLDDLTLELHDKKVIVNRQDIFDQSIRFIYTYGKEEFTNKKVIEIWEECSTGDVDIINKIPLKLFEKYNDDLFKEGTENFENLNFTDSNSQN